MGDERWLVTGSCGQLGGHLLRRLSGADGLSSADVLGIARRPCGGEHANTRLLDVKDRQRLDLVLDEFRPTHVVHLAGVTSPFLAEADPANAWLLNVGVARHLAAWARSAGAWFLYPSTDFIWGYETGGPWKETDTPRATSPYARDKLHAEQVVSALGGSVARFSLMYGQPVCPRRSTWTQLRESLERGCEIPAVTDELRTPVALEDVATVLVELGRMSFRGLVHVAGPDVLSPYELFGAYARSLGHEAVLRPVSRRDLAGGSARPRMMAMDAALLTKLLGRELPSPLRTADGPDGADEAHGGSAIRRAMAPETGGSR